MNSVDQVHSRSIPILGAERNRGEIVEQLS